MILLLLALLTPQVVMPAPARANASFVNRAINSDGTLNLSADLHGNLDLTGWQVKLDRQRGPILRPDRAPAAVPLLDLGVWSALGAGLDEMGGVSVIAINGSDVYVGGSFPQAIGVPDTGFIAKWDGSVYRCGRSPTEPPAPTFSTPSPETPTAAQPSRDKLPRGETTSPPMPCPACDRRSPGAPRSRRRGRRIPTDH